MTRLPAIFGRPSYVGVQRAYRYGYETERLGWFFNRGELIEPAAQANLTLVREFLLGARAPVSGAPSTPGYRGYLFKVDRT